MNTTEDLDLSIKCIEASLGISSEYDLDRAGRLGHLGSVPDDRFRQLNDLDSLKESIKYKTEALGLLQIYDHRRAETVSSLANAYATQFSSENRERDIGHLDKSIKLSKEALSLASTTTDRPYIHYNLGMSYHYRFKHKYEKYLGLQNMPELLEKIDMTALDRSIEFKERTLSEMPHGHCPGWITRPQIKLQKAKTAEGSKSDSVP